MGNTGIDIGKSKCVVRMVDQDGEVLEEAGYTNTSRTVALLARCAVDKYGPSHVRHAWSAEPDGHILISRVLFGSDPPLIANTHISNRGGGFSP